MLRVHKTIRNMKIVTALASPIWAPLLGVQYLGVGISLSAAWCQRRIMGGLLLVFETDEQRQRRKAALLEQEAFVRRVQNQHGRL